MKLAVYAAVLLAWVSGPAQGRAGADRLVGKPAPAITADQWMPAAPAYKGKVVLIDFWATWCAPCIAQFPTMREWQKRFGDDLVIIGVTNLEGQTLAQVKKYLARAKLPWPVAVDNRGVTHKAFGVRPIPHTFLIDRAGVVRAAHVGAQGFTDLLPEVEKQIAQR